jgi:hypothetical protein
MLSIRESEFYVMQLMKNEKSILPVLMTTVVLLVGSNTLTLFGHNFSPDESASFLALVDTIKTEAQLVQQNIASNNLSLASAHANKALALMTDNVTKEIAERSQRLSDDLNTDLSALKTFAESATANNTANDVDILVDDINGVLDEIVTARIDPDQLNNSTIQVLAAVELLDGVLKNYGDAFAVGHDMANMSMMTMMMDGTNNVNMGGTNDATGNMSMEDMSNSDEKLVNMTGFQTAQVLAMKLQELFDSQTLNSSLSKGSETVDQSINDISAALKELVANINGKSSPMDIMTIVHTRIHPNLMNAFGLQLENN